MYLWFLVVNPLPLPGWLIYLGGTLVLTIVLLLITLVVLVVRTRRT